MYIIAHMCYIIIYYIKYCYYTMQTDHTKYAEILKQLVKSYYYLGIYQKVSKHKILLQNKSYLVNQS